jgi:hypothetical protein
MAVFLDALHSGMARAPVSAALWPALHQYLELL